MAVEALLPSEVARLVYGYLIEEKCNETAQTFLNESQNLHECRTVLSYGRNFTTRVCGLALMDILEKFCLVNTIVQEKFQCLKTRKYCGDLVSQVKFLLEECEAQPVVINNKSKNISPLSITSPTKYHRRDLNFCKDESKTKQTAQITGKSLENQNQKFVHQSQTNAATEATLLRDLPGYIDNSQAEKYKSHSKFSEKTKSPKKLKETQKEENILQNETVNRNTELQKMQNESKTLLAPKCNGLNKNIIFSTNNSAKSNSNSLESNSNVKSCYKNDENIINNVIQENSKRYIDSKVQSSLMLQSCLKQSLPLKSFENVDETCTNPANQMVNFIENIIDNADRPSNTVSKLNVNKEIDTNYKTDLNIETQENMETENLNEKHRENVDLILREKISENVQQNVLTSEETDQIKPATIEIPVIVEIGKSASTQCEVNVIKDNFKVPTNETQNNLQSNSEALLNPLVSPILQRNSGQKMDNFSTLNNTLTSTPIKMNSAMQNFYSCDWFTTQDLPIQNNIHQKENATALSGTNFAYACVTTSEKLETTASCFSPITTKDQTLHTPVVVYSPKVSQNIIPSLSTNTTTKNETPVLQKGSEISDDKIKINSDLDSLSALLRTNNSNEYNRYFSLESIKLFNLDADSSIIQSPITVPEVEVDGMLNLSGLTPYLKIKQPNNLNITVEQNEKIEKNINMEPEEFVEKTNKNEELIEESSSAIISSEVITKNTPETLLENRIKNNRLSLSTPKKPSNYMRALNFDTPLNKSQSESKLTDIKVCLSPETFKRNHNKSFCKSSLFQSPTLTNTDVTAEKTENFVPTKVFSDIVEPTPMELSDPVDVTNEKLFDTNNKLVKDPILSSENSKDVLTTDMKDKTASKKSWDSDLRKTSKSPISTVPYKPKHKKLSKEERKKHDTPKRTKKRDENSPKRIKKDKKTPRKSKKSEKIVNSERKKEKKEKTSLSEILRNETKIKLGAVKNEIKDDSKILKNNHKTEFKTLKIDSKFGSEVLKNNEKSTIMKSEPKFDGVLNDQKIHPRVSRSVSKVEVDSEKNKEKIEHKNLENEMKYDRKKSRKEKKIESLFECTISEKDENLKVESQIIKTLKRENKSEPKISNNNVKVEFKALNNERKTGDIVSEKDSKVSRNSEKESNKHDKILKTEEKKELKISKGETKNESENLKNEGNIDSESSRCDVEKESKSSKSDSKVDSRKPKSELKVESKISNCETRDEPQSFNSVQKIDSNSLKLDRKMEFQNSKHKNKIESTTQENDKKIKSKDSRDELKKFEPKLFKNEEKREPETLKSEPKIDSKKLKDNEKPETRTSRIESTSESISLKYEQDAITISKSEENMESDFSKTKEKIKLETSKDETRILFEALKIKKDSLEMILSDSLNDEDEHANIDNIIIMASKEINNLNEKSKSIVKRDDIVDKLIPGGDTLMGDIEKVAKDLDSKNCPKADLKSEERDERESKRICLEESKTVDYAKIEKELFDLTNSSELDKEPPTRKNESLYERISKVERGGEVIEKKYARLTRLNTSIIRNKTASPLSQFTIDLDTPRKDENSLKVPLTPRVLSPNSASLPPLMTTGFKLNEDSHTFLSYVATPIECPLTPNIVLTPPKSNEENTSEAPQKQNGLTYYEPTSIALEAPKKSPEITQFEVIKENLFKDEKAKAQTEPEKIIDNVPKLDKSMSKTDCSMSSSCDSSSSTSSSSSNSSCSSLSSDEEEEDSPEFEKVSSRDEEVEKENAIENKVEASPVKVFTINKTDKELCEAIKETPAKDENLCVEAGIFETPNYSKPTENPTNLNAKISQMMILKEQEAIARQQEKSKPRIISIERLQPKIITKPTTQLLRALPLNIQMKALEIKNEAMRNSELQKRKIDKSEEEVAQAIESIIPNENEKCNNSIITLDQSIETTIASPNLKNDSGKSELFRAIESITNPNFVPPEKSNSADESGSEENLELVLEDEGEDTRSRSPQTITPNVPLRIADNKLPCKEFSMVFDEETYKRRRRKAFPDNEMMLLYQTRDGRYKYRTPTPLEMLFVMNPPRKKRASKVQLAKQEEKLANDDVAVADNGTAGGTNKTVIKRKRAPGENESTIKRKKDIFIY